MAGSAQTDNPELVSASCSGSASEPIVLGAVEFPMLMSFGCGYWSTVLQWDGRCQLVKIHQLNEPQGQPEEVEVCPQ